VKLLVQVMAGHLGRGLEFGAPTEATRACGHLWTVEGLRGLRGLRGCAVLFGDVSLKPM